MDDPEVQETVESILGKNVKVIDCEKKSTIREEEILLINGLPVTLEGRDGRAIKQALLTGQVPPCDLLNTLLIKTGILKAPVKLETSLSVKTSTITKEEVTVARGGKIVDERSREVKENNIYTSSSSEVWEPVKIIPKADLPKYTNRSEVHFATENGTKNPTCVPENNSNDPTNLWNAPKYQLPESQSNILNPTRTKSPGNAPQSENIHPNHWNNTNKMSEGQPIRAQNSTPNYWNAPKGKFAESQPNNLNPRRRNCPQTHQRPENKNPNYSNYTTNKFSEGFGPPTEVLLGKEPQLYVPSNHKLTENTNGRTIDARNGPYKGLDSLEGKNGENYMKDGSYWESIRNKYSDGSQTGYETGSERKFGSCSSASSNESDLTGFNRLSSKDSGHLTNSSSVGQTQSSGESLNSLDETDFKNDLVQNFRKCGLRTNGYRKDISDVSTAL